MEFRFVACGCPQGDWLTQTADLLQTHTQLQSRQAYPGIWKLTDRMAQMPKAADSVLRKRQRRRTLQGIGLLLAGIFLMVPGLMNPQELALPLLVGTIAAVSGLVKLLPRRKPSRKKFLKSAAFLLKRRAAVKDATVVFTEEGMTVAEGAPVPCGSFLSVIEGSDLVLLTWDDQVLLLFRQELQTAPWEEFSVWLASQTTVTPSISA